ncbi:MAG: ATP-dependent RecD-like DNA helicase [Haliscomenobacter sp.]|nr:ATP-dependent RecD-like DNA helicase [Haliscomenobacter sp.]
MKTLFNCDPHEAVTVEATLDRIVWQEGDRMIGRASNDEHGQFSVLGSMTDPVLRCAYVFRGKFSKNERYGGMDLRFDSYRAATPTSPNAMVRYLSMQAKFVGPVIAANLVDNYGTDTLRILKEDPARVARDIQGITLERANEISRTLQIGEEFELAFLQVSELLGDAVSATNIRKAIKKWGSNAADKVKVDPWILMDLPGIGFARADEVYQKMGGAKDGTRRHVVALACALEELTMRSGSTLLQPEHMYQDAAKMLGCPVSREAYDEAANGMLLPVAGCVGLDKFARAEQFLADWLRNRSGIELHETDRLKDDGQIPPPGPWRFPVSTEGLAPDQAQAVRAFESEPTFILCGSPGTGKTYTVARIVASAKAAGLSVALAAPTGKAAKQMRKAMQSLIPDVPATTVHTLLQAEMDEDTGTFRFMVDETNPLSVDLLVVDETSMLDVSLARSLLRAVTPRTRVLFVGDNHQLPSVGPGAILRDMLAARTPPSFELTEIKRNAGTIVRACHAFKRGDGFQPDAKFVEAEGKNWRHIEAHEPADIIAVIHALLSEKLPAIGVEPFRDTQIISPTNSKTGLSCDAINEVAKAILNPTPPDGKLSFAVGDRVIQLKNAKRKGGPIPEGCTPAEALAALDALSRRRPLDGEPEPAEDEDDLDSDSLAERRAAEAGRRQKRANAKPSETFVVNGDIGVVVKVEKTAVVVTFTDPARVVKFPRNELDLRLAYCVTCHKMQGSEAPVVILPVHRSIMSMPMVTREWMYTAFSRAKRMIVTVGPIEQLFAPLRRCGNNQRATLLRTLLQGVQL